MKFHKYHGLGNDYIVIDPKESEIEMSTHPHLLLVMRTIFTVSESTFHS
jgi:diaminopimelate epimerase